MTDVSYCVYKFENFSFTCTFCIKFQVCRTFVNACEFCILKQLNFELKYLINTNLDSLGPFEGFHKYAKFQFFRPLYKEDMIGSKLWHYGFCEDSASVGFDGLGESNCVYVIKKDISLLL